MGASEESSEAKGCHADKAAATVRGRIAVACRMVAVPSWPARGRRTDLRVGPEEMAKAMEARIIGAASEVTGAVEAAGCGEAALTITTVEPDRPGGGSMGAWLLVSGLGLRAGDREDA